MSDDDTRVDWPKELKPPFRWDVRRREQLGGLLDGWTPSVGPEFVSELVRVCARVIAFCGDGDLVFVGRSPDPLFDFLSGAFAGTSWEGRLRQLPVSLRYGQDMHDVPGAEATLRRYLASLELAPRDISRRRPTTLVDMVDTGGTFGNLVQFWHRWSADLAVPWVELQRKLRLIGLVVRKKTSPKTWRWQQHAEWTRLLSTRSVRNVSAPHDFIVALSSGNKASRSFPQYQWPNPRMSEPSRRSEEIDGLRTAVYLYELGRTASAREQLAAELAQTPGVHAAWLRSLVVELRARAGSQEGFQPVPDDVSPLVRLQQWQASRREEKKLWRAKLRAYRAQRAAGLPPPPPSPDDE